MYRIGKYSEQRHLGITSTDEINKSIDKSLFTFRERIRRRWGKLNKKFVRSIKPCPTCGSRNIKCRGSLWNCEDCGKQWHL